MKKVLFLGDIVGRPGRNAVIKHLPSLREKLGISIVIANAENAAGGAGLTAKIAHELKAGGVDAITLGDHTWDQKQFVDEIDDLDFVCRPANMLQGNPGRSSLIVKVDGLRLGIFTVLGRNYLTLKSDCPFRCADDMVNQLNDSCDAIFSEVHMEATSEKIAMGWYLNGRTAAVIGTHTHVPTADAAILSGGTAYQSDAGMCGPYHSVLGREIGPVIETFKDGMKRRFPVASDNVKLLGCCVTIDNSTGKSTAIDPVNISID